MQQTQLRFIVKNELVAMYGIVLQQLGSGLSARTLNVAQFPSIFSTLNTQEQQPFPLSLACGFEQVIELSLQTGIVQGVPFPQHVYNITGRVLQIKQFGPPPNIGRSQESKQFSGLAFCCNINITFKISAMQLP